MQNYIKKYDITPFKVLKVSGLALVGLVAVTLAVSLIGATVRSIAQRGGISAGSLGLGLRSSLPSASKGVAYDQAAASESMPSYGGAAGIATGGDYKYGSTGAALSVRNVASSVAPPSAPSPAMDGGTIIVPPPEPGTPPSGDDAEEYEVKSYSAYVETRDLKGTCGAVSALKSRDYVIFLNSNEYDRGCSYDFKVKKEKGEEILAVVKGLKPKDMSENVYTIKKQVEDFTGELDILKAQMESTDRTLTEALAAYDEISKVATRSQNADALAKIIDSKIGLIERLANAKVNISAQMERLGRAKAEALDQLYYTQFSVSVTELKFIDGKELADSWKAAIKQFVRDVNDIVQEVTVNLAVIILVILQYSLYVLILVAVAKYGWQAVKWIWKR